VKNPWEQRETAIACGFDPASLSERAARRRTGDAGLGRVIVVPVYLRRPPVGLQPELLGLRVRLSPGGDLIAHGIPLPADLGGDPSRFWMAVHRAADDPAAAAQREGWTRILVRLDRGARRSIVLRDTDWALLRAALTMQHRSEPQDAPAERVAARFLGRLDGVEGTQAAELWGRLALEVVTLRHPDRLADTTSLRWYASWGAGGSTAGAGGRATGSAGPDVLMELAQQRFRLEGRPFRVRTLPDWEREQAAHDLGRPPGQLMAWPVSPLPVLLAYFDDITPAPMADVKPQDAPHDPRVRRGPQDAR
jgi:hypothetical protein